MASLSTVTSNDPQDDGLLYVPPRSSAFRTSLYPGFFSPGSGPSMNPNPVTGTDPVAAPSVGEFGYTPPAPPPAQQQSGLSSVTSNPLGQNSGGTSADERASNQEQVAKSAGEVTDPMDAARAVGLGLGMTSPLGIAGLAVRTGAALAGAPAEALDPLGGLMDDARANPFDIRSNTNKRPGFSEAYDAALASAHNRGLHGPQASQAALESAKAAGDIAAAAASVGAHRNQTPTPMDVTAANSVTGFSRPVAAPPAGAGALANTAPAAPAAATTAPAAVSAPGAGSATAPTNPGAAVQRSSRLAPGGAPRPGGGGAGANGGSGNVGSKGSAAANAMHGLNAGGKVTAHHKEVAKKNHTVMKALAARTGKTPGQIAVKHKDGKDQLGAMSRLHMEIAQRAIGGKKYADGGTVQGGGSPRVRKQQTSPYSHPELAAGATPATPWIDPNSIEGQTAMVGRSQREAWLAKQQPPQKRAVGGPIDDTSPDQSDQYNPPPEATMGDGDTEPAMLTPGEMVLTKPAAVQYRPEVLAAMNDPEQAAEINDLIERFLSDDAGPDDGEDAGADGEDDGGDNGGLGVMADLGSKPAPFMRPKSKLASVTSTDGIQGFSGGGAVERSTPRWKRDDMRYQIGLGSR